MKKLLPVALIFGGRSAEHEVSIISARAIYKNLNRKKYQVISIYVTKQGKWKSVSSPEASRK
ncbi:MAG: D-alanine--D-alanine ligase A, partial [Acidobacteriota bacterium]|nr:D-alanine--D-alanine ligase A [Acidobacteriota bacterium]